MNTPQGRLQLALGVCWLVLAIALWFAGTRMLAALATDLVSSHLDDDAEALLAALAFDADGCRCSDSSRRSSISHFRDTTGSSSWMDALSAGRGRCGTKDLSLRKSLPVTAR